MVESEACEKLVTVFDNARYARMALGLSEKFRNAKPFPHVVIDDFLPDDIARLLADAYPDPRNDSLKWKTHFNSNVSRKFVEDIASMPTALRLFGNAAISKPFLLFLEALSGIDCLISDPYFIGGGAMATGRGEFLKVHADFNWHHKLQAHRRLNALLYLTPDWDPEWGGALELWPEDMSRREQSILPLFNRLVVFEVSDNANHGQPEPLNVPEDVYRRVFSIFCYTTRKTDAEWNDPHFTMYRPEKSPYGMSLQQDYAKSAEVG